MFAAPPKYSEEDIRRGENEATGTMRQFVVASIILYLSPFALETVWKLL
ncbi:hypothetical protein HMPREF1624_06267 [Sporothrix schenckii ATCC 58251]|uniref:Mitochondrial outer membrane translocase complex, subunit Tom5 n=1 Tax=Sporothrix schenckii (strain ATCC 58251 / de Perez 2211183) TaxID=1391915 RepID=U7PR50_SPOS1|nr:hypothetical protein HMPREF1624_06267 [Sporothrix schenckii ATCC 58251]